MHLRIRFSKFSHSDVLNHLLEISFIHLPQCLFYTITPVLYSKNVSPFNPFEIDFGSTK